MFLISEPHACDAYYRPLLSNFLKISRSSNDEKHKGGQEEGDVVEVDEKQQVIIGVVVLKFSVFALALTVIFHVQVEVHVEFTYLSVDGAE